MPTTTNRAYSSPAHAGAVDTWDSDLNTIFNQIDQNLGAVSNVALSNVPVTLNSAQYVCGTIIFSGTLTANVVVTFPSVSGWWKVFNACTGNFYVQLTCGAGVRVCAPPGQAADIFTNGLSVVYCSLPPVGSYLDYAGSSVPSWIANCTEAPYLLCDGSTFSAVTYPTLAVILGGTTLPDARGRYRAALDGGTSRITTAGGGVDGSTIFTGGGQQNRTITTTYLPATPPLGTSVSVTDSRTWGFFYQTLNDIQGGGSNGGLGQAGPTLKSVTVQSGSISGTVTGNLGSGTAMPTLPPTLISGITLIRAG